MKPDSLVVMEKGYNEADIELLHKAGINNYPTVGGGIYTVRDIFNWKDLPFEECLHKSGDWMTLNEFPEMEKRKLYLNVNSFREIQSPDEINVGEIIEDAIFVRV